MNYIVLGIIFLVSVIGILAVVYIARLPDTSTSTSTSECLDQVTSNCTTGSELTCQTYAECLQLQTYTMPSCGSDWFKQNCSDFKPGPGGGSVGGATFTWSGPYYKISTFATGTQSALDIDLSTINTIVLNVDFSSKYIHNESGSEFAFAMRSGKTAEDLMSEYKDITVTVSPNDIQPIPYTGGGTGAIGIVSVGASPVDSGDVQLLINTNEFLGDKQVTFTFTFVKKD